MSKKYTIIAKVYSKKGKLLATGINSYTKTHPLQYYYAEKVNLKEKLFLHAEIAAIIKTLKTGEKPFRIVVERYDKDGNLKLAKPCPVCMEAIKEANIKVIEYSVNNDYNKITL